MLSSTHSAVHLKLGKIQVYALESFWHPFHMHRIVQHLMVVVDMYIFFAIAIGLGLATVI